MVKLQTWLAVGGILALLLWLLTEGLLVNLQAGRSVPRFSVYRYDPLGMAALRTYLKSSGNTVRLLKHPAMNTQWRGVLIDIHPPAYGGRLLLSATLSRKYHPRLMQWVQRGNTLFEVTYHNTRLTRHEGITVQPLSSNIKKPHHQLPRLAGVNKIGTPNKSPVSEPRPADDHHRASPPGGKSVKPKRSKLGHRHPAVIEAHPNLRLIRVDQFYATHRNPKWFEPSLIAARWQSTPSAKIAPSKRLVPPLIWLAMPSRFECRMARTKAIWRPLLTYHGQSLAIERRYGKGHIVLLGSPWPLLNGGIDKGSNLEFLMSIIGHKPVIFNEWGLGIGGQMTTLDLISQFGLAAFGFQVLVLLVAALWEARRFPQRHPISNRAVVASNIEQIAMLGRLYQRSLSQAEIRARVAAEVHSRLAAGLKVQPRGVSAAVDRLSVDLRLRVRQLLANVELMVNNTNPASHRMGKGNGYGAELLTESANLCEEIKRDRTSFSRSHRGS